MREICFQQWKMSVVLRQFLFGAVSLRLTTVMIYHPSLNEPVVWKVVKD